MRTGYVGNFQSFSPDGRRLVATSYGNIDLYDAGTGDLIANILSEGNATHVDWAPDDSALVFSMTDGHSSDWTPGSIGRIAKMTHLGNGLFAAPEILFEAPPGWHAYYPAWSPDSQWIAFNVSTGDSYDDPDAELWLMYRNGDGVVRLDRANMGESLTNSWPRWGPLPDDDVLWLAFASRREYGSVKVNTTPQVWVTAIDPFLAADGVDPSKPAFWLPGQDTSTGNHIPVWSK